MQDEHAETCLPEHNRRSYDQQLEELRQDLHTLQEKLEPAIAVWMALAGLVTVLKWVGTAAKYLTLILGAIAAIIGLKKFGG